MLVDVTYTENREITRQDVEKFELLRVFRLRVGEDTFNRITSMISHTIDQHVANASGRLVWESTGALIGHSGAVQLADEIWKRIIGAVGDEKECKMVAGMLIRWVIAGRDEDWLMYRRDTETTDEDGKPIYCSEYWIGRAA